MWNRFSNFNFNLTKFPVSLKHWDQDDEHEVQGGMITDLTLRSLFC
jgi:hypothetical protein